MSTLRRRPSERVMSALWGAIVATTGVLMIVTFSGYTVDLELALIIAVSVVGAWLLLSAALPRAGRPSAAPATPATPASSPEPSAAPSATVPDAQAAAPTRETATPKDAKTTKAAKAPKGAKTTKATKTTAESETTKD